MAHLINMLKEVGFKIVNESISDLVLIGLQLMQGFSMLPIYENFRIGVTLKLGLPTYYQGDGISLSKSCTLRCEFTLETRSAEAVLPACLVLGIYDFLSSMRYAGLSKDDRRDLGLTGNDAIHRITLAGAFIANAYSNDIFSVGVEYAFKRFAMFRAGYSYEPGQFNLETAKTFYTGPSVGATFGIPMSKDKDKGSILYIDYGYRFTNRWGGNHYIGLKLAL